MSSLRYGWSSFDLEDNKHFHDYEKVPFPHIQIHIRVNVVNIYNIVDEDDDDDEGEGKASVVRNYFSSVMWYVWNWNG